MDWHVRYKNIDLDDQTFTSAKVTVEFYNMETEDKFEESFKISEDTIMEDFLEGIFSRLKVINDFNNKIAFMRNALGKDVEAARAASLGLKFEQPSLKEQLKATNLGLKLGAPVQK